MLARDGVELKRDELRLKIDQEWGKRSDGQELRYTLVFDKQP